MEFKESNDNFRLGISLFLKEGNCIGIKPSISISSLNVSMPIVIGRGFSYLGFPMKVVAGVFALAGLLFYNWSEDPEPKQIKPKEERYKEDCSQWNLSHGDFTPKQGRLTFLAVYVWDIACKEAKDKIQKSFNDSKVALSVASTFEEKSKLIQVAIEKNCEEAFNLTEAVSASILMDSVSIKLDPDHLSPLSTAPAMNESREYRAAAVYYLDGVLTFSTFDDRILIGRRC